MVRNACKGDMVLPDGRVLTILQYVHEQTTRLFDIYRLRGWKVRFIEVFPRHPEWAGFCDVERKIVWYSRLYLRSTNHDPMRIILHELAHCLTPSDVVHGNAWKQALRDLQNTIL